MRVDSLLFSDIHLGSRISRAKDIETVLQKYEPKKIIWLGDIFDTFKLLRFSSVQVELFRSLQKGIKDTEQIFVLGNHERRAKKILHKLLDMEVVEQVSWEVAGKKLQAMHGHQFDPWARSLPFLTMLGEWFHEILDTTDKTKEKKFSQMVMNNNFPWPGGQDNAIDKRALLHLVKQGINTLICGHSHKRKTITIPQGVYLNTGSWTQSPASYVVVHEDGNAILETLQ